MIISDGRGNETEGLGFWIDSMENLKFVSVNPEKPRKENKTKQKGTKLGSRSKLSRLNNIYLRSTFHNTLLCHKCNTPREVNTA